MASKCAMLEEENDRIKQEAQRAQMQRTAMERHYQEEEARLARERAAEKEDKGRKMEDMRMRSQALEDMVKWQQSQIDFLLMGNSLDIQCRNAPPGGGGESSVGGSLPPQTPDPKRLSQV